MGFSYTFLLQYASLLLLILTFFIGIFVNAHPSDVAISEKPKVIAHAALQPLTEEFDISSSVQEGALIESETLSALLAVAKAHDVDIHCEVRSGETLQTRLSKTELLGNYFVLGGVPKEAVEVLSFSKEGPPLETCRIIRSGAL